MLHLVGCTLEAEKSTFAHFKNCITVVTSLVHQTKIKHIYTVPFPLYSKVI
jgi:hypothetical protein